MSQLYVPDGVFLVCTDGMSKQALTVTSQTTIKIAGGRLAATRNDRMCDNHNCAKMVIAGAIIGAIVAGIIAAATVATGGLAGAAIVGAIAAGGAVVGAGVGLLAGLIPCICALLTHDWLIYHPEALLEKQEALLENSTIPCRFGGSVMIFYSQEAADAAVNLKRWDTVCNVGIIAITAFAMSFTGVYKGIVAAGKGIYMGFSLFGFKIGMANLGQMFVAGGSSYLGGYLASNIIINPIKNAVYEATGIKEYVTPTNTNIENVMNEGEDGKYVNPDKPLKEIGKVSGLNKGNKQMSPYEIKSESKYEMYNIKGQTEHTVGTPSTSSNVKDGAVLGKTSNTSSPQYNAQVRMSDSTGYAEGGTRTETTTGTQYNSNWKGAATQGFNSFKPSALGKSALMSLLADGLAAIKNPIVKGPLEEFEKSLEIEEKARESIKVQENNI